MTNLEKIQRYAKACGVDLPPLLTKEDTKDLNLDLWLSSLWKTAVSLLKEGESLLLASRMCSERSCTVDIITTWHSLENTELEVEGETPCDALCTLIEKRRAEG